MEIELPPVYVMNPATERDAAVDPKKTPVEEIEPLSIFIILKNDDEQLLLLLPGYFKGEPIEPEIQYDAGQHAILVRGPHQLLLMDDLNPDLRGALAASEKVLVQEIDSKRRYVARVVKAEVGPLGRVVLETHRYFFEFHPFPVHDGSLTIGEAVCDYCRTPVKIFFRGRTDKNRIRCACPNCIENGEMIGWGESFFERIDERSLKGENWCEVFGSTVPFLSHGKVPAVWGIHCGVLGVYLGKPEPEDLIPELREELSQTWNNEWNLFRRESPENVFTRIEKGEEMPEMHLFRCRKCNRVFGCFV